MLIESSRIKFTKSPDTGEIIGFVSRNSKTKLLRGVPENSPYGKKICVLPESLKGTIEPGVLYDVELREMHNGSGFVVTVASRSLFEANVITAITPGKTYKVKITFGNKTIFFDPKDGQQPSCNTIDGVLKVIGKREDLRDKEEVCAQFVKTARALLDRMAEDGMLSHRQLRLFD